jgi:hypothetical protein
VITILDFRFTRDSGAAAMGLLERNSQGVGYFVLSRQNAR